MDYCEICHLIQTRTSTEGFYSIYSYDSSLSVTRNRKEHNMYTNNNLTKSQKKKINDY
jgi:hypothetical protein